ncbi:hypothetical protein [Pseudoalteromonas denitrificans]|uniref:Phospholipase_D-nuclease N-terminal n=1 Tax=Pseudoalteromonas denitrificans DSM 6059 TaxID=1123010 RepID=A0A1I1URR5_9GAMM|nr:hypothetical protein [Pseudoalteromonas denitrificans]SFD72358.1 hypothetical protein SAMN02745724_05289 [Pseudoalteromonas denitrificans DSM 6059]
MTIDVEIFAKFIIVLAVINTLITLRAAKKAEADNLWVVAFIAIPLNLFIYPAGWFYTFLWCRRLYKKNLLDKQS